MKSIDPEQDKLPGVFSKITDDIPIIMVNLLKFREKADYNDNSVSFSGPEAYQNCSKTALKKVKEVGGEPVWMGEDFGSIIAPDGEEWGRVLLVKYPSIKAVKQMLSMPEYQKCIKHRTAALENSRLIATVGQQAYE
jgi:uncharacterized protein (DUF1330 family)